MNPSLVKRRTTSRICSVKPRFSWHTSTSGMGPLVLLGRAWYAMIFAPSAPANVMSWPSTVGSFAATDSGLRAAGDGDAAAAGDAAGDATGLATADGLAAAGLGAGLAAVT